MLEEVHLSYNIFELKIKTCNKNMWLQTYNDSMGWKTSLLFYPDIHLGDQKHNYDYSD